MAWNRLCATHMREAMPAVGNGINPMVAHDHGGRVNGVILGGIGSLDPPLRLMDVLDWSVKRCV